MFCQNCGKLLEQGERFCSACGAKAEEAQPVEPTYEIPVEPTYTAPVEPAPAKGGNKKLFMLLGIIGGAVLVLAIAAYFIIGFMSNTPENVAEDFVTAYCEYDAEGMVDCVPDFLLYELADDYDCAPTRSAIAAAMKLEVLGKAPRSLQVLSVARTYEYTYADFMEDAYDEIEDMGGTAADVLKVTDVCVVEIKCIIDGDVETIEVYCMEYDGDWCALDMDW